MAFRWVFKILIENLNIKIADFQNPCKYDSTTRKGQRIYFLPNKVKGSINIFLIKSKERSMANPSNLKGNNRSHTMGYKINATIAIGQQRIKRMHQRRKLTIIYFFT
jgi:hypothetical protein